MFKRYNIISEADMAEAAEVASAYVATRAQEGPKVVALDYARRRKA